jgi:hypothetical protein
MNSDNDSCLTERWNLEYESRPRRGRRQRQPIFRYVEVDSIEDRVFVVEESPGVFAELQEDMSTTVVMVKHKESWKNYFTETG